MPNLGLKAELRDGETIRAYLDELARLKTPVQLSVAHSGTPPLETTVERISGQTFLTATTLQLPAGTVLTMAFMLEARRFTAPLHVVGTGVYGIPQSLAQGERRTRARAPFTQADRARVVAVEGRSEAILGGRVLNGPILDLSPDGLRLALEELSSLTGEAAPLEPGDAFACVSIQDLPHLPPIQCRGTVRHLVALRGAMTVGLSLDGLGDADVRSLERILGRRLPAQFGAAFPKMRRRTDVADQPGIPTPTKPKPKAPEVVEAPPDRPAPAPASAAGPPTTPLMKLRKLGRKILIISGRDTVRAALAEGLAQDGFKYVTEARTYLEAQKAAKAQRYDLVLLDLKVGGSGEQLLAALKTHNLVTEAAVILMADRLDALTRSAAEAVGAVHVHQTMASLGELLPVIYERMLR